jgi:hypothetical protein
MRLPKTLKGVVYIVAMFVALYLLLLAHDARADSEMRVQAGSAVLRGETPFLGLNVKWPDAGPGTTDWEAGFLLSGASDHRKHNPQAVTAYGMLVPNYGPFELGVGFAYTNNEWEYTCQGTFALMAGYMRSRWSLRWMHFSSAGSCLPNSGRDFIAAGWRF